MRRAVARALVTAWCVLTGAALLAPAATADDVDVTVTIPDVDGEARVDDAQLRWGLNAEAGSGAFFGGCNFLSAGVAGDAGSARLWTGADASGRDALFRSTDGDVRVEKPTAAGGWREMSWDDRCTDAAGRTVTSSPGDLGTGVTAVLDGGEGVVDLEEGTARIQWRGSVTVVFYGGLTYWWLTDPVLEVDSSGRGRLTADVGGFGASMEDLSKWERLPVARHVELATLDGVELGEDGLRVVPAYAGVRVSTPDGVPDQQRDAPGWGSFPQGFVDVQVRTGQAAYWFSSGGLRDFAKPATTLWVSYDAASPVPAAPTPPSDPVEPVQPAQPGPGLPPAPSAGGAGGGLSGAPPALPPGSAGPVTIAPVGVGAAAGPLAGDVLAGPFAAPTWLSPGLIPLAAPAPTAAADTLAIGAASALSLACLAFVGFRSGWLVLPFSPVRP